MPIETQEAVDWALTQTFSDPWGNTYPIKKDNQMMMVDKVREYFNTHAIVYSEFSYDDLIPYLPE